MNKYAKIESIIASDFSHSWQCSHGASHLSGMLWARFFQSELYEQNVIPPWGAHTSPENSDRKPNYNKMSPRFGSMWKVPRAQRKEGQVLPRITRAGVMDQATLDLGFEEWIGVKWVKASAPQTKVRESHAKEHVSPNKQCLFKEQWTGCLKDRALERSYRNKWGIVCKRPCTPSQGIGALSWR